MPKTLVVVESPGKIGKISEILGPNYVVKASFGHIRDIPARPKTGIGISTDGKYTPDYQLTESGQRTFRTLKAEAARCDKTLLATDPDREGEAISWHIADCLGLDIKATDRITFNEISRPAIEAAIKNPRAIDMNLVRAQETRRSLDRLIGYTASPILSGIIGLPNISAGRVQSPATLLIVTREREIQNFVPTTHYGVRLFFHGPQDLDWSADWDRKPWIPADQQYMIEKKLAEEIAQTPNVIVLSTKDTKETRSPPAPFTTSTMQQVVSKKLSISVNSVMQCAQHLYEEGLITYHRSDTPNISETGFADIVDALKKMGLDHVPKKRTWKSKENAQEAHEAIRPSHADNIKPVGKTKALSVLEEKVYHIIRERALASQMPDAIYAVRTIVLEGTAIVRGKKPTFTAKGKKVLSPGWTSLTAEEEDTSKKPSKSSKGASAQTLPDVKNGEKLNVNKNQLLENTTSPPPRYTEATLVQAMEKHEIGRPSTYAQTINGIKSRNYVTVEPKTQNLIPTDIAFRIIDEAKDNFSFVNLDYTAKLEKELDEIASGKRTYLETMQDADNILKEEKNKLVEKTVGHKTCPKCGSPMVHRMSKAGTFFWGCSGWPKCTETLPSDYKAVIPTGASQKTQSPRSKTRHTSSPPRSPTPPKPKSGGTKRKSSTTKTKKPATGGLMARLAGKK